MNVYSNHKRQGMKIGFKSSTLTLAIFSALHMQVFALENMTEDAMRGVSGQDGLAVSAEMSSASIDRLSWQDGAQGSMVFGDETNPATQPITISPTAGNTKVTTTLNVQTSANSTGIPAMSIDLGLGPVNIEVPKLNLCDSNGNNCQSLGALAVTNKGENTKFSLITTNGLLSKAGTAKLKAVIDNMTVAIKQTNGGSINQLMLGNMYANMTADGKLFVTNEEGLRFIGSVDFDESTISGATRDGLEILVQHKSGANNAKTLGKIALTGGMTDVDLAIRGVTGTVQDLGFDNGDNGIAMRMSANFKEDLKLKLGDKSGIALTGWKNITDAKSFDTGNVYLNIIPADATVNQTLEVNNRLTKTASQLNAMEANANANYLTRNFVKEEGDTNTTPFGTTGKNFVSRNGFVLDNSGNIVKAFDGLKHNYTKGIVNKNGQYLSVKDLVKDGYVTVASDPTVSFPDNGDPDSFWQAIYPGDDGSKGGSFQKIFVVTKDGNGNAIVNPYQRRLYDSNSGTGSDRGIRQIYVWRSLTNGNPPEGQSDIVVGSFDDDGRGESTPANAWFKAVNLKTGNRIGGNNLTGLNGKYPYRVNNNGEVRNESGVLLLQRHAFNEKGFLVENSRTGGNINDDNNGATSGNGDYVHEYTYALDETNNQLVLTHKITGNQRRIKLATFDKNALQAVGKESYKMSTDTISGDDGTSKAGQSIGLNIRGMSLQAYATQTEFFDKTLNKKDTQDWSVAPVLYDVNANMLLFPKTLNANNTSKIVTKDGTTINYTSAGQAIGYKLVASTKGSDGTSDFNQANAKRTTGLLVTDTNTVTNKTRYVGLRHVDSLIRAQGDIQFTGEGIAVTAKDFLFAFRGELASGTIPTAGQTFSAADRLMVAEGRLKGNLYAKILPVTKGLGFDATLKLDDSGAFGTNSGVRLTSADGNSSLNMAEITGMVRAKGNVQSVMIPQTGGGSYKGALQATMVTELNPTGKIEDDVRIRHIGYSATPVAANTGNFDIYQDTRLGEVAFSPNTIKSTITIGQ